MRLGRNGSTGGNGGDGDNDGDNDGGGAWRIGVVICCGAITRNLCQSIYAQSSIGRSFKRRRSASFVGAFAPGRRRQCMERAIIKHLFSGVLALRSAQFWRSAGADLRRSDRGRLKRSRTRIYSPTHRCPYIASSASPPRCGSSRLAPCVARCCIIFFGLCYWVAPAKGSKGAFAGFAGCCASPFLAQNGVR